MVEKRLRRPFIVALHGLPYFSAKLARLLRNERWDVRFRFGLSARDLAVYANDLRRCDLAYTWGGRISMGKFLWAARCFRKKRIVMLWSGSDVMYARQEFAEGKMVPWIARMTHWAVSPWIAEEVRTMGLRCEYIQASFVNPVGEPKPLPEKFSVVAYVASIEKKDLYGWDRIVEVASALPSVEFNIVGLQPGQVLEGPANINVHSRVEDAAPFIERATVLYRPVRHDGLSFMVLETLAQGRHVLYSYPLPACIQVRDTEMAIKELQRLHALHDSRTLTRNEAGMQFIARDYAPEKVRAEILRRWEEIIVPSCADLRGGVRGGIGSGVPALTGPAESSGSDD
ncbi:MAG: hypothetical protein WB780_02460 [Candidatus Acidiferrales bacterium]